eukprot:TRINITY_DN644_c0_g1_i3.p1 TRINITY_DN644_c0_g1~~TRINITY_DN644_c0_g1_i3.p1  ORF type:complete len:132 (+),score=12.36 TRINITY_DN644_c0_g1_i3:399-794(+)
MSMQVLPTAPSPTVTHLINLDVLIADSPPHFKMSQCLLLLGGREGKQAEVPTPAKRCWKDRWSNKRNFRVRWHSAVARSAQGNSLAARTNPEGPAAMPVAAPPKETLLRIAKEKAEKRMFPLARSSSACRR